MRPATMDVPWVEKMVSTVVGDVPRVATTLRFYDRRGSWKARWGIGRMRYTVTPGLYAVGNPTPESLVFVSANYKMSFDRLRSQLTGRDAWIMVLDTKGINVWCAAGKGTFGTDEVVNRVSVTRLADVVSHRTLVLPQLSAPGVSAHEVKWRTGFTVVYGPVRAEDLPAFLDAGMKATPAMRRVRFPIHDRIVLIPVELVMSAKYAIFIIASFFLLAGLGPGVYSSARAIAIGLRCAALFLGAYIAGAAVTPALLPWLPGRSFSSKGGWAGFAFALVVGSYAWARPGVFENGLSAVAWFLMIPAVASFLGMNFTGASTYTSLSGVRREMRVAVPLQILGAVAGLGLWLAGRFV
jgi:acetyl-CoA decarbonylase/synthase complex subunit gamma